MNIGPKRKIGRQNRLAIGAFGEKSIFGNCAGPRKIGESLKIGENDLVNGVLN